MAEGAILEPPTDEAAEAGAEEQEAPEEVPSVLSVTNRHLIGACDVSDAAEDGSRVIRLFSANRSVVIEASLAPELCAFLSGQLVAVKVIAEDDEVADAEVVEEDADAGSGE